MKVVIKNHEMYDSVTGYRVQPYYGSFVTGVDFQKIKKESPDGTEIMIRNIWDHWNYFDPDRNSYTTMIKSKYLQVEELYRPPVQEQNVINSTGVDENGDSGNSNNSESSGVSNSDVSSTIQEQSNIPDTVSENNTGEHTDVGTTEAID